MSYSSHLVAQQELLKLPHGPEFRFIDQILELDPGVSAKGSYQILGTESFLPGHFPENPMWPAVIMLEAIAQLGGVAAQSDKNHERLNDMRLTAVKNAKILGSAEPGSELCIEVSVEARMGRLVQISGRISEKSEDQLRVLAKAVVTLSGS